MSRGAQRYYLCVNDRAPMGLGTQTKREDNVNIRKMLAASAAGLMVASLTQCKKSPTAPATASTRTHSVVTTVQVPATPTAPITLSTNDPESNVQVTLDVAALQQLVQLVGGAAQIKMTDMAPKDYTSLPASEAALVNKDDKSLATLVFDISASAAAGTANAFDPFSTAVPAYQTSHADPTFTFNVKNNSGKRCLPGKVDLEQIFGSNATDLNSTIFIDDDTPRQNIIGTDHDLAMSVEHFIFCFECPRVTPTGASGG